MKQKKKGNKRIKITRGGKGKPLRKSRKKGGPQYVPVKPGDQKRLKKRLPQLGNVKKDPKTPDQPRQEDTSSNEGLAAEGEENAKD